MNNQEEYIKQLEARIEELQDVIDNYVENNSDGQAWMVQNTSTGLFWKGGYGGGSFSKTGKVYPKAAYLKSSLRQHCPKPGKYRQSNTNFNEKGYRDYTDEWIVVETATIVTRRYQLQEFLGDG